MSQRRQQHVKYNPEDAPMHGQVMSVEDFERLIEQEDRYHYELIDGVIYAMAPPSPAHDTITVSDDSLPLKG